MTGVLNLPQVKRLLSSEHFSVDGTLIEAWASMKSFVPKDGSGTPPPAGGGAAGRNAERDFHGEKRSNDTHASTTDPDARLFRKGRGKEAKLCHMGHIMTENRHGLIVDARLTEANGTAECATALDMVEDNAGRRSTLGADKNYDTADFVAGCRARRCVPHVAQNNTNRRSAIDGRTTRHPGYAISMIKRKRIEEPFGWMKDRRCDAQNPSLRTSPRRMVLRSHRCRLQSDPHPQAAGDGMSLTGATTMPHRHTDPATHLPNCHSFCSSPPLQNRQHPIAPSDSSAAC